MGYPSLVNFNDENECKQYFKQTYCEEPIVTHDGIPVRFIAEDFEHSFYESSNWNQEDKSIFSNKRAERIDWIKEALQDEKGEFHPGWDKKKKKYNHLRRVILANGNHVVVIQLQKNGKARFITSYPADSPRTLSQIKNSPEWKNPF